MRIAPRSNSSAETRPALVVALSGRALAAAARRTGDRTVVLDLFRDCDTARLAVACRKLPRGKHGFVRGALVAAVRELGASVRGLVYGAGLEHDPTLLAALAAHLPILGNAPEVVTLAKDPIALAALLARLGVPHPETTRRAPANPSGWLAKRSGGTGGTHIARAVNVREAADVYFQKAAPGRACAALFLADGRAARLVGFSEQWAAGDARAPYRFGGCAGPARMAPKLAVGIAEICDALAAALGLVGLNSLDFLVEGERFTVLEINPRPGATLDIFDATGDAALWRLHLGAVARRLPRTVECAPPARAAAILYAERRMVVPPLFRWPAWTSDRGAADTTIMRGGPICTILASGVDAAAARKAVERRAQSLRATLDALQPDLSKGRTPWLQRRAPPASMR